MNKIFMVAGEVSGDQLGAWLCAKRYHGSDYYVEGVGGPLMQAAGIHVTHLYTHLNSLTFTEILGKIVFYYRFMHEIVAYLKKGSFNEIVLIDYPGMNLRLAQMIKRMLPHVRVTFAAPPQTWAWGSWRIKKLQQYCDEVIVLYPFEIAWYQSHGLSVTYLGSPVVDRLQHRLQPAAQRLWHITIAPGSRHAELIVLLPVVADVVGIMLMRYPSLTIYILCPATYTMEAFKKLCCMHGILIDHARIHFIDDESKKKEVLSLSCAALLKPGTVTLEAGLLQVPSVIFFKTNRINALLARWFMKVAYRGLPNLLADSMVMAECLQERCTVAHIVSELSRICTMYENNKSLYAEMVHTLFVVRKAMGCDDFV